MNEHLLSLTIWLPIVGAILVVLAPKNATKGIAALASFLAMVASIAVTLRFVSLQGANPPAADRVGSRQWGGARHAPRGPQSRLVHRSPRHP